MANQYFHKLNGGKNFKIGSWLLANKEKDENGNYTSEGFVRFNELFGWNKKLFVYNLGPNHVNSIFFAPIVLTDYPYPIQTRSMLTNYENHLLKQAVDELLRTYVLRKSESKYSSPARPEYVNGKLEIIMDYSYINTIIVERHYHIPSTEEVVNSIQDSNIFSKIVIKGVYHQYTLDEKAKNKTAFTTDFGQFEFNTLHQGLKNADEYIQEMFETILGGIDSDSIKIRLGQILIHTTEFHEHMEILRSIFQIFTDAKIKIDAEDSLFLMLDLEFLGYHLSDIGVSISLDNIQSIRNSQVPRNLAEMRAFLKLTDKFRSYLPNYELIVGPLVRLSESRIGFYWNMDEQKAFDSVKRKLVDAEPLPFKARSFECKETDLIDETLSSYRSSAGQESFAYL